MFPRLFTLEEFSAFGRSFGPFTLHTYGVLLAVAFLVGLYLVGRQARREGLDPARLVDLGVYLLIAGLVGAKLMLVAVEWRFYLRSPGEIWSILQSGGVFYGGFLAALPVAWWYTRRHALDRWRVLDVLVPGVALGQAIGRLGCFAAGCCHGRPTGVWWAVTFRDIYTTRTVGTPIDTPLHPVQLYESAAVFLVFLLLLLVAGRKRFHGQVFVTYVFLYAAARFGLEFFRGDASRGTVMGGLLSTSQFVALLLAVSAGLAVPFLIKKKPVQRGAA
jgi:phosphatidylglycerol---prolipoprotein diacylglyceryl transferase